MKPAQSCPELAEIERFVADTLEPDSSKLVRDHVTTCVTCTRQVEELRADKSLASRLARAFSGESEKRPEVAGFRVLRELGRGGMGVVYEAEQISPPRRVALKVVRGAEWVDAHTLQLFQREIRVLARLEHPGIASLYDAGTTRGEHWFAMEMVDGQPLVAHARDLPLAERLERFQQLCAAIDHAHQHGIVHRDLKPSNVLVTRAGRVQVLDFGLAKITDGDVSLVTEAGHIRGTLAYMSPEQARGEPEGIGLRSDVYSLGVILYELVTGALPVDTGGVPIHEAARRVVEEAPRRPSALAPGLAPDLETIVLKALEKEPHRRYASAAALAEDVRRFLSSEVILARPPSALYELSKLVARHRLPFALAGSLVLLAVGTAIWTTIRLKRESDLLAVQVKLSAERETALSAEKSERERAEKAGEEARAAAKLAEERLADLLVQDAAKREALDFLTGIFSDTKSPDGRTGRLTAVELLKRGIARLEPRTDMDPFVRTTLLREVGGVARDLGLYGEADRLLAEAIELTEKRLVRPELLRALLAEQGLVRREQSRNAESLDLIQRSVDEYLRAEGPDSVNTITARKNLAQSWYSTGRYQDCIDLARELLSITERVEATRPKRLGIQSILGLALYELERLDEAEEVVTAAIAEAQPGGRNVELANVINTLGMIRLKQRRLEEGRTEFQSALDMRLALLAPDDDTIASSYNNLAAVANMTGDKVGSLEMLAKAQAILEKKFGPDSLRVAMIENNRSRTHFSLNQLDAAEPLAAHALEVRRAKLDPDHPQIAESLLLIGDIALKRERYSDAETSFGEALRLYSAKLGERSASAVGTRFKLGQALLLSGRFKEAESSLSAALEHSHGVKGFPAGQTRTIEEWLARARELVAEGGPAPEQASKTAPPR